jgi:hypothetical protein
MSRLVCRAWRYLAKPHEGAPRIVYATAIMRAAWSGDLEVVKLLLAHGANPHILSKGNETTLVAAAGEGGSSTAITGPDPPPKGWRSSSF